MAFRSHPVLANVAAGSITLVTGDLVAQTIELRRSARCSGLDGVRSLSALTWAAIGDVPITLALFRLVDGAFASLGVLSTASSFSLSVMRAVCFTVPGAVIRNPAYLVVTGLIEHAGRAVTGQLPRASVPRPDSGSRVESASPTLATQVKKTLNCDMLREIIANSLRVWIPANTFGFHFVPSHYRPLYTTSVQVCWNTYLSLASHRSFAARSVMDHQADVLLRSTVSASSVCGVVPRDTGSAGSRGCPWFSSAAGLLGEGLLFGSAASNCVAKCSSQKRPPAVASAPRTWRLGGVFCVKT